MQIKDILPKDAEVGVGLALKDNVDRYLFFIAGSRYTCPPGKLFFAGIGGHLEAGETYLQCAHREVREEIDTDVVVDSSPLTW